MIVIYIITYINFKGKQKSRPTAYKQSDGFKIFKIYLISTYPHVGLNQIGLAYFLA
jgi:hypothetical protein